MNVTINTNMKKNILDLYDKSLTQNFVFSDSDKIEIQNVISDLDSGKIRVCEKITDSNNQHNWITHEWIKKAILLYFKIMVNKIITATDEINFFDKVPIKKWTGHEGVRVVPLAIARYGSFIESGAILMPSYVNIGARVGNGSMIDTWATVGSCAQIGRHVHLSGGVGIGGVLEPVQAQPVIIEDDCFIGSRCVVVEGVHLEEGVVLGAGVTLTASTKIIDVTQSTPKIYKGRVPKNSVVIPGFEPKQFLAGTYNVPAALIIGTRKESTNKKTSLNDVLRDFNLSV